MRAQVLQDFGGPENFKLSEVDKPMAGDGQVLVCIHAAAINQIDVKIREGLPIGPDMPAILGADLAGIVEAVGEGVTHLRAGDEVFGCAGGVKGHGGTMTEYIAADARLVVHKPESLSFHDAAALPLVGITAWDAMETSGVKEGEHVLVQGGVGGVGNIGVQLAKALGARVSTTVSTDDAIPLAEQLGADDVINFRKESIGDYVVRLTGGKGFDVVFDTVGGPNLVNSFEAAGINGRIVTTAARTTADLSLMHAKSLSLHAVFMLLPMLKGPGRERHGEILSKLAKMVDAGTLMPLVDPHTFTLETLADAHRHISSGDARGKIVIDIV